MSLITDCQGKPGWPFNKLSVWGRSSTKQLTESDSDSSVKHAQLCEYICKKDPEEGGKYCDCDDQSPLQLSSSSSSSSTEGGEGSSTGQKQISLSEYFKQETNPSMKRQMCSLICSEDSTEAANYCDCDNGGSKESGKSVNQQSTKLSGFQSLADYFKSNNNKDKDQSLNTDPHTRLQLCQYICSDDPEEAKQYCDCNQINLIGQQSNQIDNHHKRQGNNVNNNKNVNGGGGDGKNSKNQFSIKNFLSPHHGHSQEDICKVICAIEPDNDDGQCGCNEGKKESRLGRHWSRIRQWFG